MTHAHNAVIVEAVRTPVGRYGGVLRSMRPDDLSAVVIRAVIERSGLGTESVEDVLWGCANQAGEDNRNVGRMGTLLAGLPYSTPGSTINRLCASSLDAIILAARAIWSGDAEIIIAGGVESMSRAPYSIAKTLTGKFGNITAYDTALGWRYPNPALQAMFPLESMGETAENVAEKYRISRQEQDDFAYRSHSKAVAAQRGGKFIDELVPVVIHQSDGQHVLVDRDEGPRPDTSLERLAKLAPVFRSNGTVTAGNSSSLNDGAAAVLVMSEQRASSLGIRPLVRIIATGIAGVDPRLMGIGPIPATQKALAKAGIAIDDIDLIELNEAFASQSIAVIRDLNIRPDRLNPNGGAIALGHPLGCSGARIMTTLVHEMKRRFSGSTRTRYGLATMCVGVGQGVSVIVESLS